MLRRSVIFLPFFYFQQTRLKSLKDVAFHGLYEWVPAVLLLTMQSDWVESLRSFLLCYFAFIAVYEIGYLANDQLAFHEPKGRPRAEKFSTALIVLFVAVRIFIFLALTFYTSLSENLLWYSWYALLLVVFGIHTIIKSLPLKLISFSYLAFARFFSPFIFVIPATIVSLMVLPVFLNYVLFRAFTYMDSKNLLQRFDRKATSFRVGFYCLILPFSIALSVLNQSWLPLVFNAYYMVLSLTYSLAIRK